MKQLVFVEGLTLAGARRKRSGEQPGGASDGAELTDLADQLGPKAHRMCSREAACAIYR